jgi:UDP-N-acetylmuramoyl-tripeptide--D-alanyl-D-alanine ligase
MAYKYNGIIEYGNENSKYCPANVVTNDCTTEFDILQNNELIHFKTHLLGKDNLNDLVAAIAIANTMGIALKDMQSVIRVMKPVEHRLEAKECDKETLIIDDSYTSSLDGNKNSLDTLKGMNGLRILVTPGKIELDSNDVNGSREFGKYASGCCDCAVVIGQYKDPIVMGLMDTDFPSDKVKLFENVNAAMDYVLKIGSSRKKYILVKSNLPDVY